MRLLWPLLAFWAVGNTWATDTPFMRSIRDFSGGVNTYSAPLTLPDNQQSAIYNMVADAAPGSLSTRYGSTLWGTWPTSSIILDAFAFEQTASNKYIVASDGSTMRYTVDGTNWTTMLSGLPLNTRFQFAICNGNLWAVSSRYYPIVFNGSTTRILNGVNTSTPPKNAKVIAYWLSRVWMANTPAQPSVINFTSLVDDNGNPLDPATDAVAFDPLNQLYINREDGTGINALVPYRGYMYVFKDNSIWRINFISEQNLSVDKIVDNVGCVNGNTVKEWNGVLVFLGSNGNMYSFDGQSVQLVGLPILPQTRNAAISLNSNAGDGSKIFSYDYDYLTGKLSGGASVSSNTIILNGNSSATSEKFNDIAYTATANALAWPSARYKYAFDSALNSGQESYIQYQQGHLVVTSTSTASELNAMYIVSKNTHNTYGVYTWTGSLLSIGVQGKAEFHFMASTMTASGTTSGTYQDAYVGLGMRSTGNLGDYKMCIVVHQTGQAAIDYTVCKPMADLSPTCLVSDTSIPDGGSYKYTYAGTFIAEVLPNRNVKVTARNQTYSACGFTLETVLPDNFFVSSTSYHQLYVQGYRGAIPGNPEHVVIDDFVTPGLPREGVWTSPAIYAANNFQWGEINYNASISTVALSYGTDVIQGTTVYYRTGPTSSLTDSYAAIGPGVAISSGADNYIQIQIKSTTPNGLINNAYYQDDPRPRLSDIFVNWQWAINGSTAVYALPQALVNDNKYYLALSTNSAISANNTIARLGLVPAVNWTLFGLSAESLFTFQSYPYAAISNKIYRIEVTTATQDGSTDIDYNLQTKDFYENAPYYPKYIQYAMLDFARSASTATVSISIDGGTTWQDSTIYLNSGSGTRSTARLNVNVSPATMYRFRIKRSAGAPIRIYGIDVFGFIRDTFSEGH